MQQLLDAVRTHPLDDAPRLVLADWLVERDDPLGALIALEGRGADPERVTGGYAGQLGRLLGELSGHVRPLGFRLGFLSEAVDPGTGPVDCPVWATVERLRTRRAALVARWAPLALRSVHLEGFAPFAELLEHGEATPLQRIWPLHVGSGVPPWALSALPRGPGALGALSHLALASHGDGADLHDLASALLTLPLPLRVLRVETPAPPADTARARWRAHPVLQRVEWRDGSWDRDEPRWTATLPPIRSAPWRQAPSARVPTLFRRLDEGVLHPDLWLAEAEGDSALLCLPDPVEHGAPVPEAEGVLPGRSVPFGDRTARLLPLGLPLGPAPWDPGTVAAARVLMERASRALPQGRELDGGAFERLVRLWDGTLALLAPRAMVVRPGLAEVQRQLGCHVAGAHPWAGATSRGTVRATNEDAFGAHPGGVWVAVDGMGGSASGAPAATVAAAALCAPGDAGERFAEACARLDPAELGPSAIGSGATAVRLHIEGSTAELSWLGDCRAALLRGGRITLLTRDHTLVGELVRDGRLEAWQAAQHPHANVVIRALMHGTPSEPERTTASLEPGDRILLLTDGVWRALDLPTLGALVLAAPTPKQAVRALLLEAGRVRGDDNATAVVVAFDGVTSG